MTPADRDLIAAVDALGEEVTERQIKDLRAHKLIPSAQGSGAGRGKGRPSTAYPPGIAERVAHIRRIQRSNRKVKLRELPIWLFVDGSDSDLEAARIGFIATYRPIEADYPRASNPDEAVDAISAFLEEASRYPQLRILRETLGFRAISIDNSFGRWLEQLLYVTIGESRSIDAASTPPKTFLPPWSIDAFRTMVEESDYRNIGDFALDVDADDLLWARDRRLKLRAFAQWIRDDYEYGPLVGHMPENFLIMTDQGAFLDMMLVIQVAYFRPMIEPLFHIANEAARADIERKESHIGHDPMGT